MKIGGDMSKLRWLLLVLFAAWNMQGKAQNLAFQSGEKISYVVFYNVMGIYVNAGNATFPHRAALMKTTMFFTWWERALPIPATTGFLRFVTDTKAISIRSACSR